MLPKLHLVRLSPAQIVSQTYKALIQRPLLLDGPSALLHPLRLLTRDLPGDKVDAGS